MMATRGIWWLMLCVSLVACSRQGAHDVDEGEEGSGGKTVSEGQTPQPAGPSSPEVMASLAGTDAEPLAQCGGGASAAEIQAATDIAYSLDDSVHELVACGGMTLSLTVALVEGVVTLVANAGGSSLPGGFEYREDGTYYTKSDTGLAEVEMSVAFSIEEDGELTRIEENLFELETYLVGAELTASADVDIDWSDPFNSSVDVEEPRLRYDTPGPWASLLGLGDPPPNPIRIVDLPDLSPRFDDLMVTSAVKFTQERDGILVEYEVVTAPMSIGSFLTGDGMEFEVIELRATHQALGQELVIDADDFQIRYGSRALDGTVAFEVGNGPLPFAGVLFYEQSAYAEVELSCL